MTLGNRIGVTLNDSIAVDDLFTPAYGSFIVELADNAKLPAVSNLVEIGEIGTTTSEYAFKAAGETLDLNAVQEAWESGIESVFPYRSKGEDKGKTVETIDFHAPKKTVYTGSSVVKPHVVIPVFPGNNCEYDSAAACTSTCPATSTSRSSRPAWNTSPPDNRRVSRLIRHTGKELSGSFPFLFMPVMG